MCRARFYMQQAPSHIAIFRTDRLGDMVLTLPMCHALRERFPAAHITLYTRSYAAPLVEASRAVDTIVAVDNLDVPLHHDLRSRGIDAIFFPRPTRAEAWAAMRARIPMRVGTGFRWYSWMFTTRIGEHRSTAEHHEAEYNVRMIMHAFGGSKPRVELANPRPNADHEQVHSPLRIVIHPGSGGSAHDWPVDRFAELAARCHDELGAEIHVTGLLAERALCDSVITACPTAIDHCGNHDLSYLLDVLATADLAVANSTGVLHLAAACGLRVLGLYPASPAISQRRWGPYTTRAIVLESTPNDDMTSISVDAALAAVRELALHPQAYRPQSSDAASRRT